MQGGVWEFGTSLNMVTARSKQYECHTGLGDGVTEGNVLQLSKTFCGR